MPDIHEIAPTRTNLLEFKSQLDFAREGKSLLEEKREVLIMHLFEVAGKSKDLRKQVNEKLSEIYELLAKVEMTLGKSEIMRHLLRVKSGFEVEIVKKSVMGVVIPTVYAARDRKKKQQEIKVPEYSFKESSPMLDLLVIKLKELLPILLELIQYESAAWKLAFEIKRTQRRVNALDNVFIPELDEIVKFIQSSLEERERETFFQMKRVKARKEKGK